MALSGSFDFTVTRDSLIKTAMQNIGVIGEGVDPSTTQLTENAIILNMIIKARAADGMQAWSLHRSTVLPFTSTNAINYNSHVPFVYEVDALNGNEASGQTVITVDTGTLFAASDDIGIELDDNTVQWTTVSGAPSGNDITLAAALTGAASDNNKVFGYTASSDRIQKPRRIISANIFNLDSDASWPIRVVSEQEFYKLGNLLTTGVPNLIYYEPTKQAVLSSMGCVIHYYPIFSDASHVIQFTYQRLLQDMDAAADNLEFPEEWYLAIMWELMYNLCPKYGVPKEERLAFRSEWMDYLNLALSSTTQEGELKFVPDYA